MAILNSTLPIKVSSRASGLCESDAMLRVSVRGCEGFQVGIDSDEAADMLENPSLDSMQSDLRLMFIGNHTHVTVVVGLPSRSLAVWRGGAV